MEKVRLNRLSKTEKGFTNLDKYIRLIPPVDWSVGHSTPAGYRGHWRPRRRLSAEEAPGPPRGKRVPGAEINRTVVETIHLGEIRNLGSDEIKNCREIYPFSTI
jgi:hypothetical protein